MSCCRTEGSHPHCVSSGPRGTKEEAIVGWQVVGGDCEAKQFFKISWNKSMDAFLGQKEVYISHATGNL